jgi:hypothetical protein
VSVALPAKESENDTVSVTTGPGLKTRKMYTSLTSEQHDQTGKENERSKRASVLNYCNEDHLLSHLNELQELNPESTVNLATRQGVKCVCR